MSKDVISVKDFLLLLLHHWKIITIIVVIGTSASLAYAFLVTPRFSTTTIFVTRGNDAASQLSSLAAMAGISTGQGSTDPFNYLDQTILDEGILNNILYKKWWFNNDSVTLEPILLKKHWYDFKKELTPFQSNKIMLKTLIEKDYVVVTREQLTGTMSLTTTFESPALTYEINKYLVKELDQFIQTSSRSHASEKKLFVEQQLAEISKRLEKAEDNLTDYRMKNIMSTSPMVMLEVERLTRQVSMNEEYFSELQKEFEMAAIDEKNNQSDLLIVKNPNIPLLPSTPWKALVVILGFAGSLMASVTYILVKYWIQINFSKTAIVTNENNQ